MGTVAVEAAIEVSPCPVCGGAGDYSHTGRDLLYDGQEEFHYAACRDCGAVYLTPMPDGAKIQSFYPSDYMVYEPLPPWKPRSLLERLVLNARYGYRLEPRNAVLHVLGWVLGLFRYKDLVPFVPGGRALDVGCGNGKYVRTLNMIGWQAEGSDFSPDAVRCARAAGLRVHEGTLDGAEFERESYDLVSARHVIEHVPDPVGFVNQIAGLLKPGGMFLVRTPNSRALGRGCFGRDWYADDVPRHLILYSPENLDRLLVAAGFRRDVVRTFTSPKIILNSLDYRTGNRGKPSRKRRLRRLVARFYVWAANLMRLRGDEIFAIYRKAGD